MISGVDMLVSLDEIEGHRFSPAQCAILLLIVEQGAVSSDVLARVLKREPYEIGRLAYILRRSGLIETTGQKYIDSVAFNYNVGQLINTKKVLAVYGATEKLKSYLGMENGKDTPISN